MIKAVAPDGIDGYFENVGGIHFNAAFRLLKRGGRVAVCGAISNYNPKSSDEDTREKLNITEILGKALSIQGFVNIPLLFGPNPGPNKEWYYEILEALKEGKVGVKTLSCGDKLSDWPAAFSGIFTGSTSSDDGIGKPIIKFAQKPSEAQAE